MNEFERALDIVFELEGRDRVSDHPADKGGLTKWGIIERNWLAYAEKTGRHANVRQITAADARAFYFSEVWRRGRCDAMPWPLSFVHFDSMTQHGRAPHLLQEALNRDRPAGIRLVVDGQIGPKTLGAIDPDFVVEQALDLVWRRLAYYAVLLSDEGKDDPDRAFAAGWINRMCRVRDVVDPPGSPFPGRIPIV